MFESIGRAVEGARDDHAANMAAVAERISRSLLDIEIPPLAGIEIAVRAAPARIVGGDYVDVIQRPAGGVVFAIGDASGKSLPAALKAMMLKYLMRGLVRVLDDDLPTIITRTNEVVCEDIEKDSYITLSIGTVASDRRSATFAVAGHDPALVWRHATGALDEMEPGGILLGYHAAATYRLQSTPLAPGDTIVMYTDGFTEAKSPDGEQFTLARLREGILAHAHLATADLADTLFDHIERHSQETLNDDATVLVVRVVD